MKNDIDIAFKKIFPDRERLELPPTIKMMMVGRRANPDKIGESLALRCLCLIATSLESSPEEINQALNKIPELLGINPDHEFCTDEAEFILYMMNVEGKSFNEVCSMFEKKLERT